MRVNADEMNNSRRLAEKQPVVPEENIPTLKKPCRIDSKTVIWIDHDADEKETIQKFLVDRKNTYHG